MQWRAASSVRAMRGCSCTHRGCGSRTRSEANRSNFRPAFRQTANCCWRRCVVLDRFDAVVFDWDGTLLDSTAAIVAAIRSAAADLELPDPGPHRAAEVIGLGLMQALSIAVPQLPDARVAEFAARYREHYVAAESHLQLFPNARELIGELRARGRRVAIATGKTRAGLTRVLDSLG